MPINLIAKRGLWINLWVISMSNIGKISVTFLSALWWFPWSPVNLNPPRGHLNCLCWSLKDFFFKTHVKNIWISKFFSICFIPCLFTVMIISHPKIPLVIKLVLITRLITIKQTKLIHPFLEQKTKILNWWPRRHLFHNQKKWWQHVLVPRHRQQLAVRPCQT